MAKLLKALFVSSLLVFRAFLCEAINLTDSDTCSNFEIGDEYDPTSPNVLCCLVPEEFYTCQMPRTMDNESDTEGTCTMFGGQFFEEVETTSVPCSVLEGVRCQGNTTFFRDNVPCIRYGGHYFPTIMLYSVFLGFLGVDRFCLGYTCLGVAKLLTLGAIGVWWVVDVFLLLTGSLVPNENFAWEQVY